MNNITEPTTKKKMAVMRVGLELLHRILLLPSDIVIEDVHVGVDDFTCRTFSMRISGDTLPVDMTPDGMRLPMVQAIYDDAYPQFIRFAGEGSGS